MARPLNQSTSFQICRSFFRNLREMEQAASRFMLSKPPSIVLIFIQSRSFRVFFHSDEGLTKLILELKPQCVIQNDVIELKRLLKVRTILTKLSPLYDYLGCARF